MSDTFVPYPARIEDPEFLPTAEITAEQVDFVTFPGNAITFHPEHGFDVFPVENAAPLPTGCEVVFTHEHILAVGELVAGDLVDEETGLWGDTVAEALRSELASRAYAWS